MRVEVRIAGDPKLYSNPLTLGITSPPVPAYRYIGLVIKNGVYTATLKPETDEEAVNVVKGQVIAGHWRITNITEQDIEFLDTNINVRHKILFTGDNG